MEMNIFNSDDSRIKRDLWLTPYDWWLRSVCSGRNYLAAAVYYSVNYYNVYRTRGVQLACVI